jgi:hypothetical protein
MALVAFRLDCSGGRARRANERTGGHVIIELPDSGHVSKLKAFLSAFASLREK